MKVKVRRIGNSLGIILPKDVFDVLGIKEGDTIDMGLSNKEIKLVLKNKK